MSGENAYQQPVTLKNVLMFSVPNHRYDRVHVLLYHGGLPVCI